MTYLEKRNNYTHNLNLYIKNELSHIINPTECPEFFVGSANSIYINFKYLTTELFEVFNNEENSCKIWEYLLEFLMSDEVLSPKHLEMLDFQFESNNPRIPVDKYLIEYKSSMNSFAIVLNKKYYN